MKLIPRRRRPVPSEIAEVLGLEKSERVLAWSGLVGGGAVAATPDLIHIVTPRGERITRSWHEVDHAAWDQDSRMLAVWWVGSRQTTPLEVVDDDGLLPEVVRERVQASVVVSTHVMLPGGQSARVALRKRTDGSLITQSLLPPGVKRDAPGVADLLAVAEAELRADAGRADLGGLPKL